MAGRLPHRKVAARAGEPIVIVVGIEVETDKGITASAVANADSKSKTYTDNSAVQAKKSPLNRRTAEYYE